MPIALACENCRHWNNSVQSADHEDSGRCTVLPPIVPPWSRDGMGFWPFTEATDSCGAFAVADGPVPIAPGRYAELCASVDQAKVAFNSHDPTPDQMRAFDRLAVACKHLHEPDEPAPSAQRQDYPGPGDNPDERMSGFRKTFGGQG